MNFIQGHLEKELNKGSNTLGFFSWMVWYIELLAPGFPRSLNMCCLPCNWETPTKVGVYFTAPWLWTFFLHWSMECGQKSQYAMPKFQGHHLFLLAFLISAITRRASSGWLLLCDLSPGENTLRADQSPYCNEVSCLPSWIWSLKQSPSQAWSRSTYPRRPTQKWEMSSYYIPWDL